MNGFSPRYREEDYRALAPDELAARYEESRRRLSEMGAEVPGGEDPVLDPGPLWLRVAFLENVIRYEDGFRKPPGPAR